MITGQKHLYGSVTYRLHSEVETVAVARSITEQATRRLQDGQEVTGALQAQQLSKAKLPTGA